MQNIQFTYAQDTDALKLTTDQKLEIAVLFESKEPSTMLVDEHKYELDDTLHGLFVAISKKIVSLNDVLLEACIQYEDVVAEHEQEVAEEKVMQQELSSPYMTGRI